MNTNKAEKFIKVYVEFISQLGARLNSDVWWATWMSSKNRVSSRIFLDLENIYISGQIEQIESKSRISAFFNLVVKVIKFYLKTIYFKIILRKKIKQINSQNFNYLIKTFVYDNSFVKNEFNDVFFPHIASYIKKMHKMNPLTVYDPIGSSRAIANKNLKSTENVLPYFIYLKSVDFVYIWIKILTGLFLSRKIKKIKFIDLDVTNLVKNRFIQDILDEHTFYALSFKYAFARIADRNELTHYLLTTEFNPWERLSILGIRSRNRSSKIIGYQHTVVPQASVNMFPALGETEIAPMMDKILTVGKENETILKKYGSYEKLEVEPSCAIRFEYLQSIEIINKKLPKKLLVAIDGVWEARGLIEYALAQLDDLFKNKWEVKFRTHPALPLSEFDKKEKIHSPHLDQVVISNGSTVKEDLEWAGAVLYWGSSVALESIMLGVPVIHFNEGRILSYDPLFLCESMHWSVDRNQNLIKLLNEIISIDEPELSRKRILGREYLKNYFWPVNNNALDKFV